VCTDGEGAEEQKQVRQRDILDEGHAEVRLAWLPKTAVPLVRQGLILHCDGFADVQFEGFEGSDGGQEILSEDSHHDRSVNTIAARIYSQIWLRAPRSEAGQHDGQQEFQRGAEHNLPH
jgi:hypothetical protein